MRIEIVVEGWIVVVREFLTPERCRELIALSEARGYEAATLSDGSRREDVRDNDRLIFDDPELASRWWARILPAVPALDGLRAVGLNERFRFYRYRPGQRFRHHTDGVFRRSATELSQLTLLVYLNDDLEGGETELGRLSIAPEAGKALLFRHQIEHAGLPVRGGTKYVLRTDVMFYCSS